MPNETDNQSAPPSPATANATMLTLRTAIEALLNASANEAQRGHVERSEELGEIAADLNDMFAEVIAEAFPPNIATRLLS